MWQFDCKRIALARQSRDMNQAELAQELGITAQQLSAWETGVVKPGQESFEKICNALKTPPKFFYVRTGNAGNDLQDEQN
jgi:transcriptional regulator with XRE-family HTH domain